MRLMILSSLCMATLIGCAIPTKESVLKEWSGRNLTEALSELGPPSRTIQMPKGITIYIWEQEYGSSTSISRAKCSKGLHVDQDGLIVDASQLSESLLLCR